jgi:hypothetical protein
LELLLLADGGQVTRHDDAIGRICQNKGADGLQGGGVLPAEVGV